MTQVTIRTGTKMQTYFVEWVDIRAESITGDDTSKDMPQKHKEYGWMRCVAELGTKQALETAKCGIAGVTLIVIITKMWGSDVTSNDELLKISDISSSLVYIVSTL